MTDLKKLGDWGENAAKKYLLSQGYKFLTSNYKVGCLELDLIFKKDKWLVFVEVKTRQRTTENLKANPLPVWQTKNLKRAILDYAAKNHVDLDTIRLDLIIILVDKQNRNAELKHYPDILM